MLNQLLTYSYQDKKKFDIVAAVGMCEIADEELSGITPSTVSNVSNEWQNFGYYTDENGIKRKGLIPSNTQTHTVR